MLQPDGSVARAPVRGSVLGLAIRTAVAGSYAAVVLILIILFESGRYLPVRISAAMLFLIAFVGILRCRFAPLSPLSRLMIALYTMPFAATAGYLFLDYYEWWYSPGALAYMSDPVTIRIMEMTGVIGLLGLLAGYEIAARFRKARVRPRQIRTLKPVPFAGALLAAFFFSYVNTPTATIVSTEYSAATGIAGRFNFNAAYLVAYTLLILLIVDAEQERSRPGLQLGKRMAVLAVTAFIVIFFQILRGDRDSFGFLVGLAAFFITEPLIAQRVRRRRIAVIAIAGLAILLVFGALGDLRGRIARRESVSAREAIVKGFTRESTATAVLLTNLSLAHSYRVGDMQLEKGKTYLQYLISLPPGFVTRALGIERPLETYQGPNFWFTDISAGGVHVVTVPFRNFLSPGAFVILLFFGVVIARAEVNALGGSWLRRLWYGSLFVGSAQWFWYGDIVFIREIMSFLAAGAVYSLSRRVGALSLPSRTRN